MGEKTVIKKRNTTEKGESFEDRIEHLLRVLGFVEVQRKLRFSGVKSDLAATKRLPTGNLRVLFECKDFNRRISSPMVNKFHTEFQVFKKDHPFSMPCFVSSKGFTEDASRLADDLGIWHTTKRDLERSLLDLSPYVEQLQKAYLSHGSQAGRPLHRLYQEQDTFLIERGRRQPFSKTFDKWIRQKKGRILLVLSDYGTGKTSMTLRYSAKLAKLYIEGNNIIPIRIDLKNKRRIVDPKALIVDHLRDYSGAVITIPGVEYFLEMYPVILFLDGLDEIGIPFPQGATINSILNLSELMRKHHKVRIIVTARTHYFRDENEIRSLWGEEIEIASQLGTQKLLSNQEFEACYILPFDEDKKISFLQQACPEKWNGIYRNLRRTELWDLASRPILFDMILDSIEDLEGKVDWESHTDLYKLYTNKWLIREEYRGVLSASSKRALTELLAKTLWLTNSEVVHWRDLTELLSNTPHANHADANDEYISHEMRTASFLISSPSGHFSFAHTSFFEFFLASYLYHNFEYSTLSMCLRDKKLSSLCIQFLTDMMKKNTLILKTLHTCFNTALRGKHEILLSNLTSVYSRLQDFEIGKSLANYLVSIPIKKQVGSPLVTSFSSLLASCCQIGGFKLPKVKMKHVDRIRNPITDEIICPKNSVVTLKSLEKIAALGLDCFRIVVLK